MAKRSETSRSKTPFQTRTDQFRKRIKKSLNSEINIRRGLFFSIVVFGMVFSLIIFLLFAYPLGESIFNDITNNKREQTTITTNNYYLIDQSLIYSTIALNYPNSSSSKLSETIPISGYSSWEFFMNETVMDAFILNNPDFDFDGKTHYLISEITVFNYSETVLSHVFNLQFMVSFEDINYSVSSKDLIQMDKTAPTIDPIGCNYLYPLDALVYFRFMQYYNAGNKVVDISFHFKLCFFNISEAIIT